MYHLRLPGESELDLPAYARCWRAARKRIGGHLGHTVELEIEPGRYMVGSAGVLVAEVRATKTMGANLDGDEFRVIRRRQTIDELIALERL